MNASLGMNVLFYMIELFLVVLAPIYWWQCDVGADAHLKSNFTFASGWMGLILVFYGVYMFYAFKKNPSSYNIGGLTAAAWLITALLLRDAVFYSIFDSVGGSNKLKNASNAVAGVAAFEFVLHVFFSVGLSLFKSEFITEANISGQA